MRSKQWKHAVLAVAAATAGAAVMTGGSAVADLEQDGDYVLALWKADGNGLRELFPQTLVESVVTDDVSLDQLDDFAQACGTYQADLYNNSDETASLIEAGVLHGPKDPHEDFASVKDKYKVFQVTDCVTGDPGFPTFVDDCGIGGDAIVLPEVANVVFEVTDGRVDGVGPVIVEAAAAEGFELPEGVEVRWTFSFTDESCVEQLEAPAAPVFDDRCGVDDDTVDVVSQEGVEFVTDDKRVGGVGVVTVTALPMEGYVFAADAVVQWSHEFVLEECAPEPGADEGVEAEVPDGVVDPAEPVAEEPETLPDTGFDLAGLGAASGVLLLVGLAVVFGRGRVGALG